VSVAHTSSRPAGSTTDLVTRSSRTSTSYATEGLPTHWNAATIEFGNPLVAEA
jgi:hypothetical protein